MHALHLPWDIMVLCRRRRFCFVILCACLVDVTSSLQQATNLDVHFRPEHATRWTRDRDQRKLASQEEEEDGEEKEDKEDEEEEEGD